MLGLAPGLVPGRCLGVGQGGREAAPSRVASGFGAGCVTGPGRRTGRGASEPPPVAGALPRGHAGGELAGPAWCWGSSLPLGPARAAGMLG
jgi:hypothetical protein